MTFDTLVEIAKTIGPGVALFPPIYKFLWKRFQEYEIRRHNYLHRMMDLEKAKNDSLTGSN